MCADPDMMRTLAAELRAEMASRRAARRAGHSSGRGWHVAACAAAACVALMAAL